MLTIIVIIKFSETVNQRLESIIKRNVSQVECPVPVEFTADCIELELPEALPALEVEVPITFSC